MRYVKYANDLTIRSEDGTVAVIPVHVFENAIAKQMEQNVLEVDGLSLTKDTFQLAADDRPGLFSDLSRWLTESGGVFFGEGGNERVVVDRDHLRSPEELHGDIGGEDHVDAAEQRFGPRRDRPEGIAGPIPAPG
jgi:hypothetical protein